MATLIKRNGTMKLVAPKNGKNFKLEETQNFVGGFIEVVETKNMIGKDNMPRILVINEEGKFIDEENNYNIFASKIANILDSDFIAGDALLCDNSEVK